MVFISLILFSVKYQHALNGYIEIKSALTNQLQYHIHKQFQFFYCVEIETLSKNASRIMIIKCHVIQHKAVEA